VVIRRARRAGSLSDPRSRSEFHAEVRCGIFRRGYPTDSDADPRVPFRNAPAIGLNIAYITDPSGVYIELTEGYDTY